MKRTDNANTAACAVILRELVQRLEAHPLACAYVRNNRELVHLRTAAELALAGEPLQVISCTKYRCDWIGFKIAASPCLECPRCGTDCEVQS